MCIRDSPKTSDKTSKKQTPKKRKNTPDKQKMPRRSPRNHNSSKAADTEIAARLTTFHIYEFQDGTSKVEAKEGGRGVTESEDRQPDYRQHQHRIPPFRISWADGVNIVILGSCACLTAAGVVFLYRHLSKKRRRKEARLMESARTDQEIGLVPRPTTSR